MYKFKYFKIYKQILNSLIKYCLISILAMVKIYP